MEAWRNSHRAAGNLETERLKAGLESFQAISEDILTQKQIQERNDFAQTNRGNDFNFHLRSKTYREADGFKDALYSGFELSNWIVIKFIVMSKICLKH